MSKRPRLILPSESEMAILSALEAFPDGAYGLQIVDASNNSSVRKETVYQLLIRLTGKGFATKKADPRKGKHPGMPRTIYMLNDRGKRLISALKSADLL